MTPKISILLAALALSACATASKSLPACDGRHRRPANPQGSVLDAAAPRLAAPPTLAPAPQPPVGGCTG
jgi:hypothetical protein